MSLELSLLPFQVNSTYSLEVIKVKYYSLGLHEES